jgi:hypothetical protein
LSELSKEGEIGVWPSRPESRTFGERRERRGRRSSVRAGRSSAVVGRLKGKVGSSRICVSESRQLSGGTDEAKVSESEETAEGPGRGGRATGKSSRIS